jgi:hypothetical protein
LTDLWPDAEVGELISEGKVLSLEAETAITKGKAVFLSADMKVSQCTATTDKMTGVALKTVAIGEFCPVCVQGVVKVTAGGAITRGFKVAPDANANVVTLPTAAALGDVDDLIAQAGGVALQTFANTDTGLIYVTK